jgi:subtilase family serine protease
LVRVQVHLGMRDAAAADAELAAVSDPKSPRYGQFLTDDEYRARYAPAPEDVAAVRAHLEASGMRVTAVSPDGAFVGAEGRTADAERAFSTRLGVYRVGNEARRAPIDAPSLPPAIAPRVLSVLGLSTPKKMKTRNVQVGGVALDDLAPDATARICSPYFGGIADTTDPALGGNYPALAYAPCGFVPPVVRGAYGLAEAVDLGIDGTGRKVAIVDAYMSPTLLSDAQTYAAAHDPAHPLDAAHFTAVWAPGTPTPIDYGWYGEQILDVESVHAMAPGADIVFVGAQSADDTDLIAAIDMVVTQHLASIVSNSYGETEQDDTIDFATWHQTACRAGLKGVSLLFASGDSGDESVSLGHPSADFPASLDNATAVGGTSLAVGQDGERIWETGWETGVTRYKGTAWTPAPPGSYVYGSGGGVSVQFAQPWYQEGFVPRALAEANGSRWRVVPDVAMVGDPITGFLVGQTSHRTGKYGEGVIGGTSLACPLFAGSLALAEQVAGHRFGFANPALYGAAWLGGLRDVRPLRTPQAVAVNAGVVATFDDEAGQAIHVAPGYDDVTGVGTPHGWAFLFSMLP